MQIMVKELNSHRALQVALAEAQVVRVDLSATASHPAGRPKRGCVTKARPTFRLAVRNQNRLPPFRAAQEIALSASAVHASAEQILQKSKTRLRFRIVANDLSKFLEPHVVHAMDLTATAGHQSE
jgi:hypothetical protein